MRQQFIDAIRFAVELADAKNDPMLAVQALDATLVKAIAEATGSDEAEVREALATWYGKP
ncbi:MAG TPA: hypothetical protein PK098_06615 [Phycisphaerales bacterium]|nr:hypothetical protein [Phycisphaerales bacterium]